MDKLSTSLSIGCFQQKLSPQYSRERALRDSWSSGQPHRVKVVRCVFLCHQVLINSSVEHRYVIKNEADMRKSKLVVHEVTQDDSGVYHCAAVYQVGNFLLKSILNSGLKTLLLELNT